MDGLDDQIDPPYLVPTHEREAQSIDPIPVRTLFCGARSRVLVGAPTATVGRNALGDVGLWLVLVPLFLAIPFALPQLDPPAE